MAFRLSHPGAATRPKHRHGRTSASQKVTAALLAASMFFISGCGIGTQNPGSTSASSHSVVDEQTTKSELENLAQELKSNVSSDPKSLTGPSSAKNTPEVQPMVETPTPRTASWLLICTALSRKRSSRWVWVIVWSVV